MSQKSHSSHEYAEDELSGLGKDMEGLNLNDLSRLHQVNISKISQQTKRIKNYKLIAYIFGFLLVFMIIFNVISYISYRNQLHGKVASKLEEEMVQRAKIEIELKKKEEKEARARIEALDRDQIDKVLKEERARQAKLPLKTDNGRVLIFIMTSYDDVQRRDIMRAMQFEPYKDYPIDWKFFVGKAPEYWMKTLNREIALYNDLVILPTEIVDDHFVATNFKFFQILQYIEDNYSGKYQVIGKIDTDCFLNLPNLWPQYLEPYLYTKEPTLVGRVWDFKDQYGNYHQPYQPHINIAFVAMTYNLVQLINRLVPFHFRIGADEIRLSHYIGEDIKDYKLIAMPHDIAADYNQESVDLNGIGHVIIPTVAYTHELKDEATYIKVASCFDSKGLIVDKINQLMQQGPHH